MADPLSVLLQAQNLPIPNAGSWLLVVGCLITIGFFSGMEIAFISANKLRIELKTKKGVFGGKWLARYIKDPNEFISTVLVAINLALVIYGIAIGDILNYYLSLVSDSTLINFLTTTIISTLVVLITAEYIPKTIFKLQADTLIFALILPFRLANILLWPLITFIKWISSLFIKIIAKDSIDQHTQVFSKIDLDNYISSIENAQNADIQEIDTEAFRNALDFSDVLSKDLMVPRTEMVAVEINTPLNILKDRFVETSLSRILVYKDNIDNIIGFIHHSDLFQHPEKLHEVLHPVIIASENLDAHDLLKRFIQERKSMAVIVDEFGGTAGIATVEDIVEEIFGEIKDEFDTEDAQEQKLGSNHYRFDARLEIDYLNEKYQFNFSEGEYNTLGGYIIFFAERIPQVGDSIRHENFEFLIKKMKGARIEEVEMKIY